MIRPVSSVALVSTLVVATWVGAAWSAEAPGRGACPPTGALAAQSSFVIVTEPRAGTEVRSGFTVEGCSRTFESAVSWRLLGRDGSEIASGSTTGGGVDGPAAFRFAVETGAAASQLAHLEVFEVDASDGEGFAPGRTVLPLWLEGAVAAVAAPPAAPDATPPPVVTAPTAPGWGDLANASFSGVYAAPIQLKNGRYEGKSSGGGASRPTVTLVRDLLVVADLADPPGDEAAVLLAESSGGSGSRTYLAVTGMKDGAAASLGTVLVGDRVQVREMTSSDRMIRLALVEGGPGDPACCPGQLATRYWMLQEDKLAEVASDIGDRLSLAAVAGEWKLAGSGITLAFEGGMVQGSAGCNRYFAPVKESGPGAVSIGPLGATKMMCPEAQMKAEREFLEKLGAVERYGFQLGKLALTWRANGRVETMLFGRSR